MLKLVIGNKTYSSWSLRPWIAMKMFEIPFEEILIRLDQPETSEEILRYSPSGRVPALICDVPSNLIVWDSLAILEFLNETFAHKQMYPLESRARAVCRSVSNEMHSGFATLRTHLSFHAKRIYTEFDHSIAKNDIDRIVAIFETNLAEFGGPYLFGDFSIADAMYAPVVGRFQTYSVETTGAVMEYCDRIMSLPPMKTWYDQAAAESFTAEGHELDMPKTPFRTST